MNCLPSHPVDAEEYAPHARNETLEIAVAAQAAQAVAHARAMPNLA